MITFQQVFLTVGCFFFLLYVTSSLYHFSAICACYFTSSTYLPSSLFVPAISNFLPLYLLPLPYFSLPAYYFTLISNSPFAYFISSPLFSSSLLFTPAYFNTHPELFTLCYFYPRYFNSPSLFNFAISSSLIISPSFSHLFNSLLSSLWFCPLLSFYYLFHALSSSPFIFFPLAIFQYILFLAILLLPPPTKSHFLLTPTYIFLT